ncbi:hypothetical protein OMAG_001765 [Candidatus Omnitrophus magneticus]|uniref:Methyltransferase n=1 Tax=Candidatus Omnitrophus magneticus TaxID=1609969 RepID=A0A0F0CM39_9BACT|nr:hypothetical protein OMAG_001765 [Candidatus Omnitrophus magneticus]
MRIIGGEYRGRKIIFPDSELVRPTKDRIRQAVFNMLSDNVQGARVIDLFSGSGAYGLEAVSRGAETADFVDNNKEAIETIHSNIKHLGVQSKTQVIEGDVFKIIEQLSREEKKYNFLFADPPYKQNMAKKLLNTQILSDILTRSSLLVFEHSAEEVIFDNSSYYTLIRQKSYNNIKISIFIKP